MPFGVYVHIPFCYSRCDYCAFATWTDRAHLVDDYLQAVVAHLERSLPDRPVTSVFVGGGTPSLVPAEALARVLGPIETAAGAEVTVECNPEDVEPGRCDQYLEAGVNRLSIGVQSMVDHVLVALGRRHRPGSVESAVAAARAAGFERVNVDLIYGAAGESLEDWRTTLDRALALEVGHVSAYALTVEPGTPLAADPSRQPDEDDQADKYLLADEVLSNHGLVNYEISNWARPGEECRHNLLYWSMGEYLGVGCAAHSHIGGERFWTVWTPDRYVSLVGEGSEPLGGSESLPPDERRLEGLQLALRTRDGVPVGALPSGELSSGPDPLVAEADGRIRLTRRGRLLANEVALQLR